MHYVNKAGHRRGVPEGRLRQRWNPRTKRWNIHEWRNGRWSIIEKRPEKTEGVQVNTKPVWRG